MNVLNLFSLCQIILDPTSVTCDTESIIDHILCNFKENIVNSGVIPTGNSDQNCVLEKFPGAFLTVIILLRLDF